MVSNDPLIGRQLANYRIEKLIGRGGMARVYLGWDIRLHRSVAVKVIDERFQDDPKYTERFLREARIMATWQHLNIPLVYHVGEYEGASYFAMEYISGQTLAQLLYQRRLSGELLPIAEVLHIGWAVANALDYAHQKGIIHRDVSPSNVSLSEDGRVVLMDFGLALDVIQGTKGEIFGTPHYIAPEQASNSANAVLQTDLYSLGVMLYEMLTGAVPFDDPSPVALALKHITDEPPPPSTINSTVTPEMESVLLKALSKKPSARYQSGKELMQALEGALSLEQEVDQSATLPEVPLEPVASPEPTLAEIPSEQAPEPQLEVPVGGAYEPPTELEARNAQVSLGGPRKPGASPSRYLAFGGLGCALVIFLGFIFLVGGIALALSRQDTPFQTSPTLSFTQVTPSPTRTRTPRSSPTSSPTPDAAATLVALQTRTSSAQITIELLFVGYKDDSLFVINQGRTRFPLAPLEFKNDIGELSGREWELDFLESGECVTLWKKEGRPKAPEDIECEQVGERLERSASERFWDERFDIYYLGKRIGSCDTRRVVCSIKITDTGP